jgi:hypothetical protein
VLPKANGDLWIARSLLGSEAGEKRAQAFGLILTAIDQEKRVADVIAMCRELVPPISPGEGYASRQSARLGELAQWMAWCLRDILVCLPERTKEPAELSAIMPFARKIGVVRLAAWLNEIDRVHEMATRNISGFAALTALALFPRDDRRIARDSDGNQLITFPPLSLQPVS